MPVAKPLIVGAGPTGLAAGLFLARRGIAPRIVDALEEPIETSKALGVNPRTMKLLEGTGVEQEIAAEGLAMRTLNILARGKPLARLDIPFETMGAAYPMTILPQARTETLLARALEDYGVEVERGVRLTGLGQDEGGVTAELEGGETLRSPILLGADGAHSAVRRALGLDFPGMAMPEDWRLMDVSLEGPPLHEGWIDFREDGPFVALPFDGEVWRLIGFGAPLLERLPEGWKAGRTWWISDFHVSHRMAPAMTVGRVSLAGDAAHIHSPIGARGMNLGIEDAYVWAACADHYLQGDRGALERYGASRVKFDAAVVRRVERLTKAVRSTGGTGARLRNLAIRLLRFARPLRAAIARQAVGLDHPLVIP